MKPPQQKELFGIQSGSQKEKFLDMGSKRVSLNFTPEKAIFLLIGLFLLLILTFCLGIERGKKVSQKSSQQIKTKQIKTSKDVDKKHKATPAKKTEKEISISPKIEPLGEMELKKDPKPPVKIYTIQLATYKKEKYANQELKKLQRYNARIEKQGKLWVIYAGRFESKLKAKTTLGKIKKEGRYKDAFIIRKISQ